MATGSTAATSGSMEQDPPDPLTPNLPIIDAVLRVIAWRKHLSHDEADEFGAWVKLRLIENDVLGKFRGDSKLQTYLTVVLNNLYFDYVASVIGKFRPSVAASAMGETGVAFERLLICEKHTVREACRILRSRGDTVADDELEALALRLPVRRPQVIARDDRDLDVVSQEASERVQNVEKRLIRGELLRHLVRLLRALPVDDRFIIRYFLQGASIAEIARRRNVDEQVLRRRLKKLFRELREALEEEGFDSSIIRELFP